MCRLRLWFAGCALLCVVGANAGGVSPELERALSRRGTHADTALIVRMTDSVALQAHAVGARTQRNNQLMRALALRAQRNRALLTPLLASLDVKRMKDLWLINAVALTLPAIEVRQLAAHPAVAQLELDSFVLSGRSQRTPVAPQASEVPAPASPALTQPIDLAPKNEVLAQWNLTMVDVPALWDQGFKGAGVVVATMDTGVDILHPMLRRKWRAGSNSWFDPHGEQSHPYDALGHGTQAMGVMVGDAGMGVAPNAKWIAVRLFNASGRASMSDIHLAFQWLLDPDGDPDTLDAPDVVNASWALTGRSGGSCITEFSEDIRTLKAAGIAVVFAAGNDGPMPNTSNSPGNNPGVLSVGAIDSDFEVARQTSRGPSACDGSVFPRVLAPGVAIRTTDLSHGGQASYTTVSGSSLAAPHVSGVLALLAGAVPSASVAELEAAVLTSQQPMGVGKKSGKAELLGRLDALAALKVLQAQPHHSADVLPIQR